LNVWKITRRQVPPELASIDGSWLVRFYSSDIHQTIPTCGEWHRSGSSIGTGRAAAFSAYMTDLGSLICRSSSEDETKAETQPDKRKMEQSKRASFIEIPERNGFQQRRRAKSG